MALSVPVLKKIGQKIAPKNWLVPDRRRTLEQLKEEARKVDLLVEIRDARIPFTSANLQFQQFLKWKEHMVVFTKVDLVDKEKLDDWKNYFKGENFFFVNAYRLRSVARLRKVLNNRLAEIPSTQQSKLVMLVGLPSVGKTTLLNGLHIIGRRYRGPEQLERLTLGKVGLTPYMTTSFLDCKICYNPPVYAVDTPSVLYPVINDLETGLKLALTGAIRDNIIGKTPLARYLLAVMNSTKSSLHSKWKAEYEAFRFLKDPLDKTKKADAKKLELSDHNIEVRGIIATELLKFEGDIRFEDEMTKLVDIQFKALQDFFQLIQTGKLRKLITDRKVSHRLLSLYRIGKLGRYTWDTVPTMNTELRKYQL